LECKVFRRGKNSDVDLEADVIDHSDDATDQTDDSARESTPADADEIAELSARPNGPFDVSEAPDDTLYLDLGSVRIPAADETEIRLDVDQASGTVVGVTCVTPNGGLAIAAFAAPRSEGIWADVRRDLKAQITAGGGLLEEIDGEWGREISTQVPSQMSDGTVGNQPARFVGVDGPRWFLRFVFLGDAATDPVAAQKLAAIARGVVVVRDSEARAPGDSLPLTLPAEVTIDGSTGEPAAWQREDLSPFERGPEITEIR
jgi:hypothetical protein